MDIIYLIISHLRFIYSWELIKIIWIFLFDNKIFGDISRRYFYNNYIFRFVNIYCHASKILFLSNQTWGEITENKEFIPFVHCSFFFRNPYAGENCLLHLKQWRQCWFKWIISDINRWICFRMQMSAFL